MVQAVDGNWYGYFADRDQAQIADSTATTSGSGLDFGLFCDNTSTLQRAGQPAVTVTDSVGIAIGAYHANGKNGTSIGGAISGAQCTGNYTPNDSQNVLREQKDVVSFPNSTSTGQIGIDVNVWPFIQLYSLSAGGNVVIQYAKGGGVQSTTLTFDTVDQFASTSLDRVKYPQNAQIHATITDLWLNIDPTDEDSWTFATNNANVTAGAGPGPHYQVFNENGGSGGVAINIDDTLDSLMCEDNCRLLVNPNVQSAANAVLTIQDNDDSILTQMNATASANNATAFGVAAYPGTLGTGSVPVTITEQGPNSGVFGTYD
jgi:hypothetical protein